MSSPAAAKLIIIAETETSIVTVPYCGEAASCKMSDVFLSACISLGNGQAEGGLGER